MTETRSNPVVGTTLTVLGVLDLAGQLALILLGAWLLLLSDGDDDTVALLLLWCVLGTAYWVATVTAVGIAVRRPPPPVPVFSWLERTRTARAISTTATFASSLVGLVAAVELLTLRDDPDWSGWIEWVAVWGMLVSWALFHWGYARIYDRRYRRGTDQPLKFPGEKEPRLADFVYFAFTNATAFSVSDVEVLTTRMRWTVVWHTTFAFFFNALILVLAVNTIIA